MAALAHGTGACAEGATGPSTLGHRWSQGLSKGGVWP